MGDESAKYDEKEGTTLMTKEILNTKETFEGLSELIVVAGSPGSGKSTFARQLAYAYKRLISPVARLDMDTMYSEYDRVLLEAIGLSDGQRENPLSQEQKNLAYDGLSATALENRETAPVITIAPYTGPIHSQELWDEFVEKVGGQQVHPIWMQTNARAVLHNLRKRGLRRDNDKFEDTPRFLNRVQLDSPPPFPHHVVENYRDTTTEALGQRAVEILIEIHPELAISGANE